MRRPDDLCYLIRASASDSILLTRFAALQRGCRRCAPGETRTPNLLIRSAKFTHSGGHYLAFCLLWLRHQGPRSARRTGVNGQSNGQDPCDRAARCNSDDQQLRCAGVASDRRVQRVVRDTPSRLGVATRVEVQQIGRGSAEHHKSGPPEAPRENNVRLIRTVISARQVLMPGTSNSATILNVSTRHSGTRPRKRSTTST
jgi:hypothetical protein